MAASSLTKPLAGRPAAGAETTAVRGTLLTVAIGEMLVQLGLTPVTAVVPGLSAALGVDGAEGSWILTVYILALAGTLLVSGRLGDLLGHRRVFGVGAVVYALAALAAGFAPGLLPLLIARGAQGIGAAMISGNNLAILTRAVPTEHRGKAIALVASASSVAAVLGAGLGTLAVAEGVWPVLFLVTVPLALWAAVRAGRLPGVAGGASAPIDWAGAGLLVATITLLAVALNHPHTSASETVMPVFHLWLPSLALIAAGLFVGVERRARSPLLDWGQLRDRAFGAAVGVNLLLHLTMMASMFLGPVLVVRGLGLSTAVGGMLMVGVQVSNVGSTFLGGFLHDRTGSRWVRPVAAGIVALGLTGWAFAGQASSYAGLMVAGLLAGVGSGMLLATNNTVIMGILPSQSRGVASGLLETTRHFGHALGVTIPTAILAFWTAGASAGAELPALKEGFFVACLAMAGLAAAGAALALVPAGRSPVRGPDGPEIAR
jgi:MFS family permease